MFNTNVTLHRLVQNVSYQTVVISTSNAVDFHIFFTAWLRLRLLNDNNAYTLTSLVLGTWKGWHLCDFHSFPWSVHSR